MNATTNARTILAASLAAALTTAGSAHAGPMVGATHDGFLVEIDRTTGDMSTIGALTTVQNRGITGMTYDPNGNILYGTNSNNELYNIDPSSGVSELIGFDLFPNMNAIAFDQTTGVLYGSNGGALWTIDPATGATTHFRALQPWGEFPFGEFASNIQGMTFDSSGNLYGVANSGNYFVSIEISSGQLIGMVPLPAGHWNTVAYDPSTDLFYASKGSGPGSVNGTYEINPIVGTANLIGETSLQAPAVLGMAIVPAPGPFGALAVASLVLLRRQRRHAMA